MNLSPALKTLAHTPQSVSSSKTLQLTPIWEEVIKNNRLPPEVNQDLIFKEIAVRLEDLEWPVRQHAFRVLYDIIPVLSKDLLDERVHQNNILSKLVINLGHPAPGIRKVASETIQKYLKQTGQSEKMLENLLRYGIKEDNLVNNDQAGILRENITLGSITSLVDILKPFLISENGEYSISQSFFAEIVEALASKVRNPHYREGCLEALWKLGEIVGKQKFFRALKDVPERDLLMDLMDLYEIKKDSLNNVRVFEEIAWSDETKSDNSFEESKRESFNLNFAEPKRIGERFPESSYIVSNDSSEDCTDGTDTETYTKEQVPNDFENDHDFCQINQPEVGNYLPPSFVAIDSLDEKDRPKNTNDKFLEPSSPRIVLEAKIPITKDKALSMKVMEEDEEDEDTTSNANSESSLEEKRFATENDDLTLKTEIEGEDKMRTPRRVRFGGEVIKLRTPDSDSTDVTIEIQEPENKEKNGEIFQTREAEPKTEANEEKPNIPETKVLQTSQIPVPVTPATSSPRDTNASRRKDVASPKKISNEPSSTLKNDRNLFSKTESVDSAPSSSGSETEFKDEWEKDPETSFWQWTDLELVDESIVNDLKNKDDWKIQYQAVEELKLALANPKSIEKIEKAKNQNLLSSLFKCLLYKLPESSHQQATILSLSIVSQLIEALPKDVIILHVDDVVRGLCRYFGGCRNVNIKIESVQALKTLFGVLEPSFIINILIGDNCLLSSSSRLRENSILAIIYATMTFPSNYFDAEKILEKIMDSAADVRRRVRQAALEAIAVLSQFCSSKSLTDNISRVADRLSTPQARNNLIAAIQARLSRRLLPSISSEGLVLYALHIPATRRFGNLGTPMGADVDWILSGTGSVSTGSAKSRAQLNVAQRLDVNLAAPLSPSKWSPRKWKSTSSGEIFHEKMSNKIIPSENPWTIQKNKNEASETKEEEIKKNPLGNPLPTENFIKENNIRKEAEDFKKESEHDVKAFSEKKQNMRPEDITWALVPLAALEESHLGKDRNNGLWGESTIEGTPRSLSSFRPLYLKLQPTHEQLILSRSSDEVRRFSCPQASKKGSNRFDQEDVTEIRLLTPTILRDGNSDVFYPRNGKVGRNETRTSNEYPTRIPVLYKNQKNGLRPPRSTSHENERKIPKVSDNFSIDLKPSGLNQNENGFTGSGILLPTISAAQVDVNYDKKKFGSQNKFVDVDEIKLQDSMSQLSGLLSSSKSINKTGSRDSSPIKNQSLERNSISNGLAEKFLDSEGSVEDKIQNKLINRGYAKSHEPLPVAVASAPPIISTELRRQTPSTSSSNSTDFGTLSRSELRIRRLTNESDFNHRLPCENYNTCSSKQKGKKASLSKSANKSGIISNHFSDNLKPFTQPKEGLDSCFNQLESQQWEVNMLGLTSLLRLLKHHPAVVLSHLHPIIVALGQQIRNLRSQVARAACQASAEMFVSLKRNVEPDLDELSGPLFHRSADTNRFIRADCNDALDKMVDNVGHAKAVSVIISKGTTHQNATVRAVAARLLLRLSERIGPEKLLSLPKETRDKMLQAGANLLTEGKLETRAFAKQVFRIWSSQPSFSNLMIEAVPPNVMRNISKTLISLKS